MRNYDRGGRTYDDYVHEESGWSTALKIFFLTVILSGLLLYYYFGPTISELRGDTPQGSPSPAPITLVIGGETFVIPENYTQFPRSRRGGDRPNVALHALLPNYEAFSLSKKDIFEGNEPASPVIHFQLESNRTPFSEEQQFERIYLLNVVDTNGSPGPYGLTRYTFKPESGYKNEELFVKRIDDGDLVVLRCFREDVGLISPSCRRDTRLLPSVNFSYRYKRVHLPRWQEIDREVKTLTLSFHRAQPLDAMPTVPAPR